MAKLKAMFSGDNLKRFFLKHGEKLVLGMVGLFVMFALMGTTWSTYEKRPEQLTDKLQSADITIEGATWSPEEQEKYPPLNVQEDVNQMLAEMSDRPFVFSTNYVGSVFGADEPRREPELLAVMDLKADSGRTILAKSLAPTNPMEGGTELAANAPAEEKKPEDSDSLLDDVSARPAGAGIGMDPAMAGDPALGMGANPYAGGAMYEEQIAVTYDPNAFIMDPAMMDPALMDGGMGMGMPMAPTVEGIPVRYISVRGVYDLRKQILNYSKALNVAETDATRLVEFLDFKLERQKADSPNGPWGEWSQVDIEVAKDYLSQTIDFDPDVVSVGVRNPVITMPLPARLIGVWRNKVNHPAVKNFELSEAEIEAEAILNREILEQAREQNKAIKQRRAPGGFSSQQLDVGQMQMDYFSPTDLRQVNKVLQDEFKGTPAEVKKKLMEKIKAQVSAVGNLVLFRYIDFDLEPGKSYRYRVSLVLRNPNYDQPVERVVHPSVVESETLETPMSEPSNVASVSPDYEYFLTRVSPPRGIISEQADLQIFQWYDETGTMIKGTLSMEPGDYIGGKTRTYVLDPAKMKYEEEDNVPFNTNDLMVDAIVLNKLDYRLHNDLKFPRHVTRGELDITPEVLVVDHEGKLKEIDPITRSNQQKSYQTYYEQEKEPFAALKDMSKKMSDVSALDALVDPAADPMMMEMMQGMEGANRLRGRRRNASRRNSSEMMMGMPPSSGMMGP